MRSFCATKHWKRLRELGERKQTSFNFRNTFLRLFMQGIPYFRRRNHDDFIEYQILNCFVLVLRAPATDSNGS